MQASASTPVKASVAAAFAAALLAAWVVGSAHVAPYLLPAPASVARAAIAFFTSPRQLGHLGITLFHIGASIALPFVVGAALALLAHTFPATAPAIHRRLSPFLNSFSGIGWTLLGVIWFGVSSLSVIFAISVVLLPFAIVNLGEGLAAQDREDSEAGTGGNLRSVQIWRPLRAIARVADGPDEDGVYGPRKDGIIGAWQQAVDAASWELTAGAAGTEAQDALDELQRRAEAWGAAGADEDEPGVIVTEEDDYSDEEEDEGLWTRQ